MLLGRNVVIALPDTALWQDQGIGFALGPGAGLPGVIVGWLGATLARRVARRSTSTAHGAAA